MSGLFFYKLRTTMDRVIQEEVQLRVSLTNCKECKHFHLHQYGPVCLHASTDPIEECTLIKRVYLTV